MAEIDCITEMIFIIQFNSIQFYSITTPTPIPTPIPILNHFYLEMIRNENVPSILKIQAKRSLTASEKSQTDGNRDLCLGSLTPYLI